MADAKKGADDIWESESVGGELFKLDNVGDRIVGVVVLKKAGKTKLGEANFYTFNTPTGEVTFIPTKALQDDIDKYVRTYGMGSTLLDIELMELKPGNFPSPFKVFKVRAAQATEAKMIAVGIKVFSEESTTADDEAPL